MRKYLLNEPVEAAIADYVKAHPGSKFSLGWPDPQKSDWFYADDNPRTTIHVTLRNTYGHYIKDVYLPVSQFDGMRRTYAELAAAEAA